MIIDIMRREIKEIIKTRRLLIIGILFIVVTLALAVVAGQYLDWEPNEMLNSGVYSIVLMFVSLLSLVLAYDTIVGERNRGSLILVLSKPIGRAEIFFGKFLTISLFIAALFLIVGSIGYWVNAAFSQELPSGSQVAEAYKFFFSIILLITCWVSFAMLFSTCFKSSTVSLVTTLVLWIMVIPMISQIPVIYYLYSNDLMPNQFEPFSPMPELWDINFPVWVKVLFAFDPDLSISELGGHFFGSFSFGTEVLTIGQSFAALVIFTGIFLIPAFILFRKLSLE